MIASIPKEGNIQKAFRIYKATLLCIFPNIFSEYEREALL